mgnify:CR=1 FL=1
MTSVMSRYPAVVRNADLLVPWCELNPGSFGMVEVKKDTKEVQLEPNKLYPVIWKPNDLFVDTMEFNGIYGHSSGRSWGSSFKSCSTGWNYSVKDVEFQRIILRNSLAMGTLSGYWFFSRGGSQWYLNFSHPL